MKVKCIKNYYSCMREGEMYKCEKTFDQNLSSYYFRINYIQFDSSGFSKFFIPLNEHRLNILSEI